MNDFQWLYLRRVAQRLTRGSQLADDGPVGQAMRRSLLALLNREMRWMGESAILTDLSVEPASPGASELSLHFWLSLKPDLPEERYGHHNT
jgi:hypothetical protein